MTLIEGKRRTRLAPQTRRTQILDDAARLILREGLTAVSMERMGREAGISKGLVYKYFPGREALLGALLQRELSELKARGMEAALRAEAFADLISQTTRIYLEHTRDRGALMGALMGDPSVVQLMETENRTDHEQTVRYFVRAARREYGLTLGQAIAASDMLMAVTGQAGIRVSQGSMPIETAVAMCVQLITGALGNLTAGADLV